MKWGMQAFDTFGVVPPGFGIVHQVNLEYLARGVHKGDDGVYYPDTLVGTDSHTTMINGIGVVGWGVGGIEAEAGMLGQPVYFLTPDVVGLKLTGRLREGCTATDLVLTVTELLRKHKVVGKFVEFFGDGTRTLALPDRATIANMAPEYGATMGFFPVDERTIDYFKGTGRTQGEIEAFEAYFKAQQLFGVPCRRRDRLQPGGRARPGQVTPSLAGPKRPQDRIDADRRVDASSASCSAQPVADNGFNQPAAKLAQAFATSDGLAIRNGDVLIAAITSCTNTSNPSVLLAAGLLAKKAVEAGLKVKPHIKTSLAPGSRIVTEYLEKTGLLPYLEKLGFNVAGYGCTTCIGNAGDLTAPINEAITGNDLICAAVLSGNRNFEARIHPNLKANFLASPPLVVAYAIAGNMTVDVMTQPLGLGHKGKPVYLGDIWPSSDEVHALLKFAMNPKAFRENYDNVASASRASCGPRSRASRARSTAGRRARYIAMPPFFQGFTMVPKPLVAGVQGRAHHGAVRRLDHHRPHLAGRLDQGHARRPASTCSSRACKPADFNSYGSRRGNHEVMMRGTFANVRIKNLMIPAAAGRLARGRRRDAVPARAARRLFIYDAAINYMAAGTPTVIFAGEEYGTGSSRDWAAKGTALLGIKAVIARSFERIHRSNLIGMGVLPLQFKGSGLVAVAGPGRQRGHRRRAGRADRAAERCRRCVITAADGTQRKVTVTLRIDTPIEVDYYVHGGILPYVLRQLAGC